MNRAECTARKRQLFLRILTGLPSQEAAVLTGLSGLMLILPFASNFCHRARNSAVESLKLVSMIFAPVIFIRKK